VARGDLPPAPGDQLRTRPARRRKPFGRTRLAYRWRRTRRWTLATIHAWRHNRALPADAPTLDFYPLRPQPRTQIVRILALLGVRIGFDPRDARRVIAWDGGTWFDPRHAARLPTDAINRRCLDVSKSAVERAWAATAGYPLAVDPLTYHGPMIAKSEINGAHDGRLIEGPIAVRDPALVYERFIDSSHAGVVTCIRTPVIGDEIPVTMIKWRRVPHWVTGPAAVEPRPTADVFSPAEIELLLRFARQLGMDYGELDVVRDAATGLIYAVDANRTPVPHPSLDPRDHDAIYRPMAEAFRALLRY
jgi:hypothetical protein